MQSTLREQLVRLERLERAGVISDDEFQTALRERRGKVLTGNGWLAKKRKRDGIVASELVSREHSVGTQQKFPEASQRDGLLTWRDAMIRQDRALVADGFKSRLVRVVKGKRPDPVGRMHELIRRAMVEAGVTE